MAKISPKNQIVFATSDDAKWHKTQEHCCNISTYRHYHCIKKKTVYAGEKFTIVPVAMFKNGVVVGSKNSKDGIKSGELKYKSSNTSIATVNAKGVVTVKKKGKCKIVKDDIARYHVRMSVATLTALLLGYKTALQLFRAERIEGDIDAVRRLDDVILHESPYISDYI